MAILQPEHEATRMSELQGAVADQFAPGKNWKGFEIVNMWNLVIPVPLLPLFEDHKLEKS